MSNQASVSDFLDRVKLHYRAKNIKSLFSLYSDFFMYKSKHYRLKKNNTKHPIHIIIIICN